MVNQNDANVFIRVGFKTLMSQYSFVKSDTGSTAERGIPGRCFIVITAHYLQVAPAALKHGLNAEDKLCCSFTV